MKLRRLKLDSVLVKKKLTNKSRKMEGERVVIRRLEKTPPLN